METNIVHFTAEEIEKIRSGESPLPKTFLEAGFLSNHLGGIPENEDISFEDVTHLYTFSNKDGELEPSGFKMFAIRTSSGKVFMMEKSDFDITSLLKENEVRKTPEAQEIEDRYELRLNKANKQEQKIDYLDRSLVHVLTTILEATKSMKQLIDTNEMQYYDDTHKKFKSAITQIKMMDNIYDMW